MSDVQHTKPDEVGSPPEDGDRWGDIPSRPFEGVSQSVEEELTPTLSVVLPTLNEEEGIGECIRQIREAAAELDVSTEIVISDSSTDRTPDIAAEMDARVVKPDRPGYGYAYQFGFERARGEYIAMGDADTTYDFSELPKLVEPIVDGRADMVIGSRFGGEIKPGAMPLLHQYVGNPLLTKFLNWCYDVDVTDAHSGLRVMRRETLDDLELASDGMEFASEMIMAAAAEGAVIEEVPITYHPRVGDATLDSFSDGWRHVKFMLQNAPKYLFSVPGLLLCATGILTILLASLDVSVGGLELGIHSMVAGSLLTIVGFNVGSYGLFLNLAGDPIGGTTDPVTRWVSETITLKRGATFGLGLFSVGAIYAAYLVTTWIQSGFTSLPMVMADVLSFTAILLGVQVVFMSFLLSSVANS